MVTDFIKEITRVVGKAGGQTYLVGGSVRDSVIGVPSKDHDLLVTKVPLEKLIEILPGHVDVVGKSFGVIKVTKDGVTIDVALPRTEVSTGVGHGDFNVHADPNLSVEEDLLRRDFTINAIAVDLSTGRYVDPYCGLKDIENCLIRAVGNPTDRFEEDPLRVLRGLRFASKLGFTIEPLTVLAMSRTNLSSVSLERVGEEFSRLLLGDNAPQAIRMAIYTDVLQQIIPEWSKSIKFEQNNPHHYLTVDEHVLEALRYAIENKASLRTRWAVFLHDIAKPDCYSVDNNGDGHFYRHEDKGAEVVVSVLRRLKMSETFVLEVSKIVKEHLRPQLDSSTKVLRRYAAEMAHLAEDALACREADLAAHTGGMVMVPVFKELKTRFAKVLEDDKEVSGFSAAQLALKGDEIASVFKVSGRTIGFLKTKAAEAVIEGVVANEREALVSWIKTNCENVINV